MDRGFEGLPFPERGRVAEELNDQPEEPKYKDAERDLSTKLGVQEFGSTAEAKEAGQQERERNEERVDIVDLAGQKRNRAEFIPPFEVTRKKSVKQRQPNKQPSGSLKQAFHFF